MGKIERFDAVKCSLKILGELFGGLGRSGFGPNYRVINSQPCCLRKKSPLVRFCEIFAPFRDFFDEIRTFGDNPVIADCPKSKYYKRHSDMTCLRISPCEGAARMKREATISESKRGWLVAC